MESDSIESEFTGPCILPVGQERSQVTRFKKMEPRKYIHTAITSRISPRNPPVKNFSLALTTNGILSGRCSILACSACLEIGERGAEVDHLAWDTPSSGALCSVNVGRPDAK